MLACCDNLILELRELLPSLAWPAVPESMTPESEKRWRHASNSLAAIQAGNGSLRNFGQVQEQRSETHPLEDS